MTVANLVTELRLVDIAVLPRQANQGIGTALLEDLLARAREAGLPVTLHVDLTNPARHLYERLGFVSVSVDELRTLMRYDPPEWTAQETPKPGSKP
jgi:ribosomal protein S18 acetylase RimI-like enzyme